MAAGNTAVEVTEMPLMIASSVDKPRGPRELLPPIGIKEVLNTTPMGDGATVMGTPATTTADWTQLELTQDEKAMPNSVEKANHLGPEMDALRANLFIEEDTPAI
jgi:hypothetical protein